MARIVIDAREYSTTTGRYVSQLLRYLARTKSEHEYLVLLRPKDLALADLPASQFQKICCDIKEFTFAEQLSLLRQINSLQPDLCHFTMVQQPIMYRGRVVTTMQDLTTVRFRNPSKNPLVFTAKQQVYKAVNQIVARKSAALLTPTEFVKRDIMSYTGVAATKITVTLESADPISDTPEPVADVTNSSGQIIPFIMYVGRPLPHKNLDRLIDAFALLKKNRPELKLVLAGKRDALYDAHADRAAAKGISGLSFTGFVSEGQLRWLYQHCAAYVFPSLSEGFGLPGLEAMLHGAPVVSSNATCLPEVYGDAARYFDPYDVRDMARQIADVIDNPQQRLDLIQKGAVKVRQYSWQRMAEQTLAVYNHVLGK